MKLLRIFGVFLAISLFAGCEVWISFWGDAGSERQINLDIFWPYSGAPTDFRAALYQNIGGSYVPINTVSAASSTTLTSTFDGLSSDTYKVVVWDDTLGNDSPDFNVERGFTTDPIDLFLFTEFTVEADTDPEWRQDGQVAVTNPN